jgi:hypothetical protein
MRVSRREALTIAAAVPALGAAKAPPPLPPIVTSGGIRLYPTWASPQWWTTEPVTGWDLPHIVSLGASLSPDGATAIQDTRNTPLQGPFTRTYFQFSTRPLNGAQSLDGVFSAAFHAIEWHRRHDAVLAVQVVVHRPDTTVRGVALPPSAWQRGRDQDTPAGHGGTHRRSDVVFRLESRAGITVGDCLELLDRKRLWPGARFSVLFSSLPPAPSDS